jgi:hypothetical protein
MMAQDERWQRRQMLTLTLGFTVRNIVAFIFKFAVPLLSGILVGTILKQSRFCHFIACIAPMHVPLSSEVHHVYNTGPVYYLLTLLTYYPC